MAVRVDKVGPDAAEDLRRLGVETFRAAYEDVHHHENIQLYCEATYNLEAVKSVLLDPETECAIAYTAEQPVGFYVVRHHSCPIGDLDGGASELKQIYVLPSHYGSGVGKVLYDDAISRIRDHEHKWVWLIVSDINERAVAFYRKQKFSHIGIGPVLEIGTDKLSTSILVQTI